MASPQGLAEAAGQLKKTIVDMHMITFNSLCANSAIDFLQDLSAGNAWQSYDPQDRKRYFSACF